ncbi:MAG: TonB family protein [Pseudomonadota bacterium]|nr:TonB family protein [Pseudomonadota bacterium]
MASVISAHASDPSVTDAWPDDEAGGTSGFSNSDRLGLALFISILVHMVVILGVTFSAPATHMPGLDTLEITLVQARSNRAPAHPDFLAQANENGGGNSRKHDIARTPLPAMDLSDRNNQVPVAHAAAQQQQPSIRRLASLLTDHAAGFSVTSPRPKPAPRQAHTGHPAPGLTQLARLERESAHLNAEISRSWQQYEKLPRQKYIDARTMKYKYAAYMNAWVAKVERVGNLNYPEQAIQHHMSGSLVLDVAIRTDGTVYRVKVLRSSGHKVLDDAAVRIVGLAAPFAPLPADIRADTDILHIIRTWKFADQSVTSGSP